MVEPPVPNVVSSGPVAVSRATLNRDHLHHHQQALSCYRRALDLYRETGDRFNEAESLTHLGDAEEVRARLDARGHPDAVA